MTETMLMAMACLMRISMRTSWTTAATFWLVLILAFVAGPVYAVETETLFDGSKIADWDTARDQERLSAEFSQSELSSLADPPALRWRFVPKASPFNDLFLRQPIARPFTTIRVRLRNQGETFVLAAKIGDARGLEWTAGRMELKRGDAWQWVELPAGQWKPAPWSTVRGTKMAFPLAYFTLIAFEIRSGAQYEIQVSRVEVVRPDPPVAVVETFSLPQNLVHGESYPVRLRVRLDKPCTSEDAWLVFRRGKAEAFRRSVPLPEPLSKWKPGRAVDVAEFRLSIPEYAVGGPHDVTLELGEARVMSNGRRMDQSPLPVSIEARRPGQTTAAVQRHHGTPTLFINGKPHNGMAYAAYGPSVQVFRDFTRAGVDLFTFTATPTEAGYGLSKTAWTAPGSVRLLGARPAGDDGAGGQPAGVLLPAPLSPRAEVVERAAPRRRRADGSRRRPARFRSSMPAASRRRAGPRRPGAGIRSRGCGGSSRTSNRLPTPTAASATTSPPARPRSG